MSIYKNLSEVKANKILGMAIASYRACEGSQPKELSKMLSYDSDEALDLLAKPPAERQELLDFLDTLTRLEALDLLGIMYVGRGDYVDDPSARDQIREAFEMQQRDFSSHSADELVFICAEKDLAFHEYLQLGLERLGE